MKTDEKIIQVTDECLIKVSGLSYDLYVKAGKRMIEGQLEENDDAKEEDKSAVAGFRCIGYYGSLRQIIQKLFELEIKDAIGDITKLGNLEMKMEQIVEKVNNNIFVCGKEVLVSPRNVVKTEELYFQIFDDKRKKPSLIKKISIDENGKKFESIMRGKNEEAAQLSDVNLF